MSLTWFDAGFVDYRKAEPSWIWYRSSTWLQKISLKWLKNQNAETNYLWRVFPCHFLSRKVLEKLAVLEFPSAFYEMRLPSVITGLGFSVARLDFPMVHTRRFNGAGISEAKLKQMPSLVFFILFTVTLRFSFWSKGLIGRRHMLI